MADARPAEHFDTLEQQAHAAHLGMWVFLASELLLFAGLFALYFAYRAMYPAGFAAGVAHNTRVLGAVNTGVLLTSSLAAASAVHALRRGGVRRALGWLVVTVALGGGFLAIKLTEYAQHFREGIEPGGRGRFFAAHAEAGLREFWTLYYVTTGLHAIHVTIGLGVLAWLATRVLRGTVTPRVDYPLALGAMYWHLVDVIWIFVWPFFYLAGGGT
jgi:cytochrome c oxidase subunit 3